jgi:hypothetical protein
MYLVSRNGGELYVAEVSRALAERGHDVTVLVTVDGALADELRRDGIDVMTAARRTPPPEVIHGQGSIATRAAMTRHPAAPALFVCHHHLLWHERIAPATQVRRYAGPSMLCVRAMRDVGAPPDRTLLLPNFVDTRRFARRGPLPESPQRALVFSNYAVPGGYLEAVRAACSERGIALDVVGEGIGRTTSEPESLLAGYDVVFAKGRAAIEALAVGCAVVMCDFPGLGPLVSSDGYDRLRAMNFGWEALDRPHDPSLIRAELDRYDPVDAGKVSDRIRRVASLDAYIARLEELYEDMVREYQEPEPASFPMFERLHDAVASTAFRTWNRLPPALRRSMRPLVPAARRAFSRQTV